MLDLDHPQTPHIFRASGLLDALLQAGQKMCLVPDDERLVILNKCRPLIAELNTLNEDHFEDSALIRAALAELLGALTRLAQPDPQREENRRDNPSSDPCARCGKTLTRFDSLVRFKGIPHIVTFCSSCSRLTDAAHLKLDSGFGTMFI